MKLLQKTKLSLMPVVFAFLGIYLGFVWFYPKQAVSEPIIQSPYELLVTCYSGGKQIFIGPTYVNPLLAEPSPIKYGYPKYEIVDSLTGGKSYVTWNSQCTVVPNIR